MIPFADGEQLCYRSISCSSRRLFSLGEEDAIVPPEVENITSLHPFIMLQESDNLWWDAFATEFFEDDATLTLTFCLEDGPKRYSEYSQPPPRIQSLFPPLLLFFLKVRITLFSETWKTRFRRLRRRHLSGCSFFLRDDTALLHGPLSPCTHAPRVCTHILNNYAPPWSNFATGGFNVRLAPPFRP